MSETPTERFYNLLPTIYRQRDKVPGQQQQLRALMAGLESEFLTLEADMDALYDNWFIETCDEWVIPYIADQVGIEGMSQQKKIFKTQRRQVANTLAYRRRNGIAATLEHVARDVTGWYVHAVEYGRRLAITQHLEHVCADQGCLVHLGRDGELEALDGPFDTIAHTVDVRNIGKGSSAREQDASVLQGRYRSDNIGLFTWRLQTYLMTNVPPGKVTKDAATSRELPPGCFTFDPLQRDIPLFSQPQGLPALTRLTGAINLPGPISRSNFANDLKAYKEQHLHHASSGQGQANDPTDQARQEEEYLAQNSTYYGLDRSLCVILNGKVIPPSSIISMDLSNWPRSDHKITVETSPTLVGIDVALGRMVFLGEQHLAEGDEVDVCYTYSFSADIGGGPYTRYLAPIPSDSEPDPIYVLKGVEPDPTNVSKYKKFAKLSQALEEWNRRCEEWEKKSGTTDRLRCTIHILDSAVYEEESELVIQMPKSSRLTIEAASGARPCIGSLAVHSTHASAHLLLNGLQMNGKLTIHGNLNLEIAHCTLMPHGIEAHHSDPFAGPRRITIDHSIVGPISLVSGKDTLFIQNSIVDHARGYAIDALHAHHDVVSVAGLEHVTIFGKVRAQELYASEVIFTQPVTVEDQENSVISYSYVPEGSQVTRLEHCQPGWTLAQQNGAQQELTPAGDGRREPAAELAVEVPLAGTLSIPGAQRIYPAFTSTRYGDPGYAQLSTRCAPEIQRGAADGSEMGAFHNLYSAQRQDNLERILDEYLPFGLNAAIFYAT